MTGKGVIVPGCMTTCQASRGEPTGVCLDSSPARLSATTDMLMAKEGTQGQSLHHSAEAQCNMGLRKFTWINYYFIIFSILALECYFLNILT